MRRRAVSLLLLLCASLPAACARRGGARPGDAVRLHLRVFAGGSVYEDTESGAPVRVVLGEGALPAQVEAALVGMRPGEERTLSVDDAYGKPDPRNRQVVPRAAFAGLEGVTPGAKVLGARGGKAAEALVVAVDSGTVTLSFDHPLAGQRVGFALKLVSIER